MYLVAFYLAVMTTSTVGFGDVIPVSDGERMFLVFSMLIGASVYAYVVGRAFSKHFFKTFQNLLPASYNFNISNITYARSLFCST